MHQRHLFLACTLLFAACGDAPRSVDATTAPPRTMPADHPPVAAGERPPPATSDMGHGAGGAMVAGAHFGGVAVLSGKLAEEQEGFLFVNARKLGGGPTYMSMKMPVSQAKPDAQGRRALHFHLDAGSDMMQGGVPEGVETEIEVRYDRDGFVDTKDDSVSQAVPAKSGNDDLMLVLGS